MRKNLVYCGSQQTLEGSLNSCRWQPSMYRDPWFPSLGQGKCKSGHCFQGFLQLANARHSLFDTMCSSFIQSEVLWWISFKMWFCLSVIFLSPIIHPSVHPWGGGVPASMYTWVCGSLGCRKPFFRVVWCTGRVLCSQCSFPHQCFICRPLLWTHLCLLGLPMCRQTVLVRWLFPCSVTWACSDSSILRWWSLEKGSARVAVQTFMCFLREE